MHAFVLKGERGSGRKEEVKLSKLVKKLLMREPVHVWKQAWREKEVR